jgi:hypothetical protein
VGSSVSRDYQGHESGRVPIVGHGGQIMRNPSIADLVAVNLRYDAGTGALNTRALAQLVAKLLFASGKGVAKKPKELAYIGAEVLGVKKLQTRSIDEALQLLQTIGLVKKNVSSWVLTESGYEKVSQDVERAARRVEGVISRNFPGRIDREPLLVWFRDACIGFYGQYGSQWAASIARRTPPPRLTRSATESLLRRCSRRHGLESEHDALAVGFHAFIASQHSEDVEHNWSLGQAMLAARLVAANIGPDPITIADFRDATVFMDTNTLLVTALDRHQLANSLRMLVRALNQIGVKLAIIHETRKEYERTVDYNRESTLRTIARYPFQVIRETRSHFIQSALNLGCSTTEEFERFFLEIAQAPTSVDGEMAISLMDDPQTAALAEAGKADQRLQREIGDVWERQRVRRKSPRALQHDAALTRVAEGLRVEGERCWILTLDLTMHQHSLARVGKHEPPIWVSIDALVQVLAVEGAGPGIDPAEFAPLMTSIINHQCEPMLGTFVVEDLGTILDIEERCADLEEESIVEIASMVARSRLSGKARNDPELQLQVKRAFQREKLEIEKKLETTSAELSLRNREIASQELRRVNAESGYMRVRVGQIRRRALLRGLLEGGLSLSAAAALAMAAFRATRLLARDSPTAEFVQLFLSFAGPAFGVAMLLFKSVVPRAHRRWQSARQLAEAELQEEQGPP